MEAHIPECPRRLELCTHCNHDVIVNDMAVSKSKLPKGRHRIAFLSFHGRGVKEGGGGGAEGGPPTLDLPLQDQRTTVIPSLPFMYL